MRPRLWRLGSGIGAGLGAGRALRMCATIGARAEGVGVVLASGLGRIVVAKHSGAIGSVVFGWGDTPQLVVRMVS